MNIRKLIDFLPYYFKSRDTYKDSSGKGILEKFLEICGDYFTDNISSVIDHSLDILDIEATSEYYLSYLWEILGQLPFANHREVKPFELTEDQQRALIKYGNAFLKIRGTKEFFEVVARVYGWTISIEVDENGWEEDVILGGEIKYPYFDLDYFDDAEIKFDLYHRMKQCVNAKFTINGTFSDIESAKKALKAFVEKYVPFNVHPTVIVNGQDTSETNMAFLIEKLVHGEWVIADKVEKLESNLTIKVSLVDATDNSIRYNGTSFYSELVGGLGRAIRISPYEFKVTTVKGGENDKLLTKSDTYKFTTLDEKLTDSLTVTKSVKVVDYYNIKCEPNEATLPLTGEPVETIVTGLRNGKDPLDIYCISTGETKPSGSTWSFDTPGTYTFALEMNLLIRDTFVVSKDEDFHYEVLVKKATDDDAEYTDNLLVEASSLRNTKFNLKVVSTNPNDDPENLKAKMSGTSNIYKEGDKFSIPAFGTYVFEPIVSKPGNKNATIGIKSNNLSFNVYLDDRENDPSFISNDVSNTWATIIADPQNIQSNDAMAYGLTWNIQLPSGEVVKMVPLDGYRESNPLVVKDTCKIYPVSPSSLKTIHITSEVSGAYKFWLDVAPDKVVTWEVFDNRVTEVIPDKLVIVPEPENLSKAWTGAETSIATYQLSAEDNTEAVFTLSLLDKDGKNILTNILAQGNSELDRYQLDSDIVTISEPGTYTYTLKYIIHQSSNPTGDSEISFVATLKVIDFEPLVELRCTPSTATLVDGKATTKLNISANKDVELRIKESDSGDTYYDDDIFTAFKPGKYTFVAMVDGKEFKDSTGKLVTATFIVEGGDDPSQGGDDSILVTPLVLEWDYDDETEKIIEITTGSDSTEWVIVTD